MCSAEDCDFSQEANNSTFRMCNVCPQSAQVNRGSWKKLEELGRQKAIEYKTLDILSGAIYTTESYLPKTNVRIPDKFFKIFYNKENEYLDCYIVDAKTAIMENVRLDKITELSGIAFEKAK